MTDPVSVSGGKTLVIRDVTGVVRTLFKPANGAGPLSLHTSADTDYQVPAGKKFIVLWINVQTVTAGNNQNIYSGPTTDSIVGATRTILLDMMPAGTQNRLDVYIEFAAGRFIIAQGSLDTILQVTGIEVDV